MGLLDVPDINSLGNLRDLLSGSGISDEEEDDDNGDLEAELMALQAGEDTRRVVSRKRLGENIDIICIKSCLFKCLDRYFRREYFAETRTQNT